MLYFFLFFIPISIDPHFRQAAQENLPVRSVLINFFMNQYFIAFQSSLIVPIAPKMVCRLVPIRILNYSNTKT
jgi:hypothetical protein